MATGAGAGAGAGFAVGAGAGVVVAEATRVEPFEPAVGGAVKSVRITASLGCTAVLFWSSCSALL
ncbi:hypothetical protein D3C72_1306610 [compost metagenome]